MLERDSKNKNIKHFYRGLNEFKKGYQPRINMVKHENRFSQYFES